MRILYIASSFPEPSKGATIYTDLAETLHEAGHEIVVAVSEQKKNKIKTEMKVERGFSVLRVVVGDYYDVGLIKKGIVTLLLPYKMINGIKKILGQYNFDLILFETPPITNVSVVAWAKKYFKCQSYLMLKDIFPQNALDLEMMAKKSITYKYFRSQEKRLYKIADKIGCMSQANKTYILDYNPWISAQKVEIFPNTKKFSDSYNCDKYWVRQRLGISKEACVFLFGGNMGKPQYVDLLCKAIMRFKDESKINFLFVGRGTEKYKLVNTIQNNRISNAVVIDNLPRKEYEQIIKECDVGLIILDPRFTIPNYPSRILSYMEYAKPILAATDNVTDIKELIEKAHCGIWVDSSKESDFIEGIIKMLKTTERVAMGNNGRIYAVEHFNINESKKLIERLKR